MWRVQESSYKFIKTISWWCSLIWLNMFLLWLLLNNYLFLNIDRFFYNFLDYFLDYFLFNLRNFYLFINYFLNRNFYDFLNNFGLRFNTLFFIFVCHFRSSSLRKRFVIILWHLKKCLFWNRLAIYFIRFIDKVYCVRIYCYLNFFHNITVF